MLLLPYSTPERPSSKWEWGGGGGVCNGSQELKSTKLTMSFWPAGYQRSRHMKLSGRLHSLVLENARPVPVRVPPLGARMQDDKWSVTSFLTLSLSMGKIFCTIASSCCLKSRAGYLASTWPSNQNNLTPCSTDSSQEEGTSQRWPGLDDVLSCAWSACMQYSCGSLDLHYYAAVL